MYLCNNVLVYFVINNKPNGWGGTGNRAGWYDAGGLSEQVFYLALTNAVLTPILTASNYFAYIMYCYRRYCASTQFELNEAFEPPEFDITEAN